MRMQVIHTFSMEGERPFIDGGGRAVRGDHNKILGWLSMQGDFADIGGESEGCHMEVVP